MPNEIAAPTATAPAARLMLAATAVRGVEVSVVAFCQCAATCFADNE